MKHFIKVYSKNLNYEQMEFIKSLLKNNFLYLEENKNVTVFYLTKSLSEEKMEQFVNMIYKKYPDDEFYFENSTDVKTFTNEQIQNMLYDLSKYLHDKSMNEKIKAGWRYGDKFDPEQKTSPLIKNYDDLPEAHKQMRPDIFAKVIEILGKNLT